MNKLSTLMDASCCLDPNNRERVHSAVEGGKRYIWKRCIKCGNLSLFEAKSKSGSINGEERRSQ